MARSPDVIWKRADDDRGKLKEVKGMDATEQNGERVKRKWNQEYGRIEFSHAQYSILNVKKTRTRTVQ